MSSPVKIPHAKIIDNRSDKYFYHHIFVHHIIYITGRMDKAML